MLGGLPFKVPSVRRIEYTTYRISGCSISVIMQVPYDLAGRQGATIADVDRYATQPKTDHEG